MASPGMKTSPPLGNVIVGSKTVRETVEAKVEEIVAKTAKAEREVKRI